MRYVELFVLFFVVALVLLFLAIVLGDEAPWYFAWVVGTAMIVLIAAAGGILFDTQEGHDRNAGSDGK